MLFHSWTFGVFALVLFAGVFALRGRPPLARSWLLAGSLFFYAWWYPPFVLLIGVNGLVDFVAGGRIAATRDLARRRRWLAASVVVNLGMLATFKYANFFLGSLTSWLGTAPAPHLSVILPIGISFYTFQSLSYTIDIHRGQLAPVRSLRDYFLFISFFPQLVAGPIVRASELLPQLVRPIRLRASDLGAGLWLFLVGLLKKLVIAGSLAPVVELYFLPDREISAAQAWVGAFAFAGQIYGDFSGYTDMARGLARMLGFELPINFRLPYLARGFSDFWRRWHVSLSRWLRDYLYVSLGGNRGGRARTLRNLLLTMLLGGLWHGAAWTFVVWGLLHGIFLVAERIWSAAVDRSPALSRLSRESRLYDALARGGTLLAVVAAWVPFRATSLDHALDYWSRMFGGLPWPHPGLGLTLLILPVLTHLLPALAGSLERRGWLGDPRLRIAAAPVLLWAVVVFGGLGGEFIYFQF